MSRRPLMDRTPPFAASPVLCLHVARQFPRFHGSTATRTSSRGQLLTLMGVLCQPNTVTIAKRVQSSLPIIRRGPIRPARALTTA